MIIKVLIGSWTYPFQYFWVVMQQQDVIFMTYLRH